MATKWGVYSAGRISNDFVSAVRSMKFNEHQFIAVAARELQSAQEFANKHQIPKAYGSYEELAEDRDVEVVYVGTVASKHLNAAKLMLNNGKHLLIEKALTLNTKQSEELLSLAKTKRLFVMEALWSRFLPSYEFVLDQIKKGVIGDVLHVNASLGYPNAGMARVAQRKLGGGTVLNRGGYVINIVEQVFNGETPEKIKAVAHLNQNGVDLGFSAALLFTNEKTATISTNSLVKLQNEASIVGTKGIIRLCADFQSAQKVLIDDKLYEFNFPEPIDDDLNYGNTGLCYQAIEVRKCLKEGRLESDVMSHKDSLLISKIQDQIRQQIGVIYDSDL